MGQASPLLGQQLTSSSLDADRARREVLFIRLDQRQLLDLFPPHQPAIPNMEPLATVQDRKSVV